MAAFRNNGKDGLAIIIEGNKVSCRIMCIHKPICVFKNTYFHKIGRNFKDEYVVLMKLPGNTLVNNTADSMDCFQTILESNMTITKIF